MKSLFKKCMPVLCALAMGCSALLPATTAFAAYPEAETDGTPIDMYLIAGQSNAVGYSSKGFDLLNGTFENVGYGGQVDRSFRGNLTENPAYLTFDTFRTEVTKGLGVRNGFIGPEYGMAETLNGIYADRADGRKAFIFKTASGGTSLRDIDEGVGVSTTGNYGNWYPRSLWSEGYKPNTETNPIDNDATGYLYELFLVNFKQVYNELKEHGYAPVVKGLAWMQGCQDLGFQSVYEPILETFITDLRTDLVEITGDSTLNGMPFVIGEIATTVAQYNNPSVPAFNEMQRRVAENMGTSVATVPTADLTVVGPNGNEGTDAYHFNCQDMETLGKRFGEKLLELNNQKIVSVSSQAEGALKYVITEEEKVVFTVVPSITEKKKYRLLKLTVNDVDVTADVVDNTYTLENPENRTYAKAEFCELEKAGVTYELDEKYVSIIKGPARVYVGDDLTFELATKRGYAIESVTANGTTLTPDTEGKHVYTVENVTDDTVVKVTYKSTGTETEPTEPSETKKKGCNGILAGGGALAAGVALGGAVIVSKRKSKK